MHENVGQFQGRMWPKVTPECERVGTKLQELVINCNMVQQKLFLDSSEAILAQAKSLNLSLCDCIVVFDLGKCPIKIDTFAYTYEGSFYCSCDCASCEECNEGGYFESEEEKKGFKGNITCMFVSKNCICDDVLDQDGEVVRSLQMQRFFPHEWLTQKSNQISDGDKSKQITEKQIY